MNIETLNQLSGTIGGASPATAAALTVEPISLHLETAPYWKGDRAFAGKIVAARQSTKQGTDPGKDSARAYADEWMRLQDHQPVEEHAQSARSSRVLATA